MEIYLSFVLIFVSLISSSMSEEGCKQGQGQTGQLDDLVSRTSRADLVFEAVVHRKFQSASKTTFGITFNISKVLKGSSDKVQLNVLVHQKCVTSAFKVRVQTYVVFVNNRTSDDINKTGSTKIKHFVSGLPVTSTEEVIRIVRGDANKSTKKIKAQLGNPVVTLVAGDKLELRCKTSGFPEPEVEWSKDEEVIIKNKRTQIKNNRRSSRLRISQVNASDSGMYTCKAFNEFGFESSTVRVQVTDQDKPHSKKCGDQTYCLNGGVCHYLISLNNKLYCDCKVGFYGPRCQEKNPGIDAMRKLDDNDDNETANLEQHGKTLFSVGSLATVAMVASMTSLIIVCFLACILVRRKRSGRSQGSRKFLNLPLLLSHDARKHSGTDETKLIRCMEAETQTEDHESLRAISFGNLEQQGTSVYMLEEQATSVNTVEGQATSVNTRGEQATSVNEHSQLLVHNVIASKRTRLQAVSASFDNDENIHGSHCRKQEF